MAITVMIFRFFFFFFECRSGFVNMSDSIFCDTIKYNDATGALQVGPFDAAKDIVAAHQTPLYVYSLDNIIASHARIRDAYSAHHSNVSLHFSLKANANFTIVKALVEAGCGLDCVSAGEVFKALHCGCPPDHIVFAGVGKSLEELEYAVSRGIGWFNVENELELTYLNTLAAQHTGTRVKVALRLNPDVQANTHPSIATGHGGAKFGLPIDVVQRILGSTELYPNLHFEGLHIHIGSQLGDTSPTERAVAVALEIVAPFPFVKCLNVGGGMPVSYDNTVKPNPDSFAAAICPLLQNYHVMLEPGRSIVASSGILICKVLYRKDQAGHKMIVVDASMTDIMRPALYSAYHAVVPLQRALPEEATEVFSVVGPVCETTDVLAKNVTLPERCGHPGQLLALMTTGAYGFVMANNYNARPLVPQVVVHNGQMRLSTKRQTFEDLIRDELDR
jgi:diaminopimelate decarboxylase